MQKRILAILALILASWGANAQQKAWTLEQCIEYALQNNLQVKISELGIRSDEEALTLAEHARYPNLNGFATNNYNWGRSFDVFTNQPITQRVRSNNFGINGNVTLYNGFSLQNQIKRAQTDLKASQMDVEKAKNDLILSLANAYLQILFGQENLANANLQVQNLQAQIERTKVLVDAGRLPSTNLLDLQSQLASSELQAVNADNALAFAKLRLRQFLQLPAEESFEISVPSLADPQVQTQAPTPTSIYATAEGSMPEVSSADLNVESGQMGIEIAKANYLPTVSMNYGLSTFYSSAQKDRLTGYDGTVVQQIGYVVDPISQTQYPVLTVTPDRTKPLIENFGFFDQLSESMRGSLGLTLSIPIYNRNQVKNSVANAQIMADRARLNAQVVRNTLRQSIEQAYQDMIAAGQTFQANKKQVEALEETFRVTQERYNLGISNITDFTLAQNNLNVAKANLVRAKYDFIFKSKIIDFYMGKPVKIE